MRIPDYITTAQTNLLRTKLRTFLTILAFVVGTFTLAMTTAFSQGLQSYVKTQIDAYGSPRVVQVSKTSTEKQASDSGVSYYQPNAKAVSDKQEATASGALNEHDLEKVRSLSGVKAVYPVYSVDIDYLAYGNQPKYVVQANPAFPGVDSQLAAGRYPTAEQTNGIVLPYPYVSALGFEDATSLVGKTVTVHATNESTQQGKDFPLVITGVLPDTAHLPSAAISYQTIRDMSQFEGNPVDVFSDIVAITADNPTETTRTQLKEKIEASGYEVTTYDDLLKNFSKPLSIVTYGLAGFASIALLAATIGIVNTLLMSVMERTQEIGLLKALGMRRRGITFIYLVEAASIGFWGGLTGVIGASLVGLILNPLLQNTIFKGIGSTHLLAYPLSYMAAIVAGAMVIGLIAGTLPAIRAGKLDPIDALRRE